MLVAVPTSCHSAVDCGWQTGSHGIYTAENHDKDATDLPHYTKMSIHCRSLWMLSTVLANTITARHCTVAVDTRGRCRMLVDVDVAL
jgi:hypothetical protein